jgi:hypothetical protein
VHTADHVLHEPPHDLQPSDPVGVLREALDSAGPPGPRLLLLGRCIEWLECALREGRLRPSRETDEAMEEWLCEECELQNPASRRLAAGRC